MTDPKPPIEWPRSEYAPAGRRSTGDAVERQRVADAEDARAGSDGSPWSAQAVEDGDEVAGADVARAEPGRERQDPRDHHALGRRVVERRPDLAGQRVGRGERIVGPLHDADRAGAPRGPRASSSAGNGRKLVTATQPTGRPWLAEVVDDGDRGVGHRAHRDEDLGRVGAAVGVDDGRPCGRSGRVHSAIASASSPGIRSV